LWALLGTGARQGEILNLRAADVARRPGSVQILSQPGSKSRGQTRIIPIPDDLADCLGFLGSIGDGRLFPYSRNTIDDWWRDLAEAVGIEGVTLHGLRATYITSALDSGIPATEVQKLVGHKRLSTTMQYYRNNEVSRKAALLINAVLGLVNNNPSTAPPSQQLSQHGDTTLVATEA
jgi:integrase